MKFTIRGTGKNPLKCAWLAPRSAASVDYFRRPITWY